MSEVFDFSNLVPRETPVVGPPPERVRYVLREASADAALRFREMNLRSRRLEDGKLVGWTGDFVNSDAVLVANCLHLADADGKATAVTEKIEVVRSWPDVVLQKLYEWVTNNSPTLRGPVSLDDLKAERRRIDARIAALNGAAADSPKASPATGAGSSS